MKYRIEQNGKDIVEIDDVLDDDEVSNVLSAHLGKPITVIHGVWADSGEHYRVAYEESQSDMLLYPLGETISKEKVVSAADAIASWLPGWARFDQQKLVATAFRAAGYNVEGFENNPG